MDKLFKPVFAVFVMFATTLAIAPCAIANQPENQPASKISDPVSITSIGNNKFAIADYETLRVWNKLSGKINIPRIIKPAKFNNVIPGKLSDHWHPTGAFRFENRLYVANFVFHDVLVFSINSDATELTLTSIINNSDFVSPESVYVTDRGIAVADYDASGVFFFSPNGKFKWKDTTLSLAHGVAMDNQYVYVGCLSGSRKLLKYDLSGKLQLENDKIGWDDILYPTTIIISNKNQPDERLAIIDANRGTISYYGEDLKKIQELGHNGPDMFNRPYGFTFDGNNYIITDTKNHRIVQVDAQGNTIYSTPLSPVRELGMSSKWNNGYAYCSHSKIILPLFSPKFSQYIGFDIICTYVGHNIYSQILLPHYRPIDGALKNRPAPGFQFAWQGNITVDGHFYWLVGSPTTNVVMVYENGNYVFTTHDEDVNIWSITGAEDYLANVVRAAQPALSKMAYLSKSCSPLFAFLQSGNAVSAATLDQQLSTVVEYPAASKMVVRWLSDQPLLSEIGKTSHTIMTPPTYLLSQGQTSFDDLRLISLLNETTAAKERTIWQTCRKN